MVSETPAPWSVVKRIAFRFLFIYEVLIILPFPFGSVPGTSWGRLPYDKLFDSMSLWAGHHLFHLAEISQQPTGSGDRAFDYLWLFSILVFTVVATAVWSLADRNRSNYATLHQWLGVYVRYFLGYTMLVYGIQKVLSGQMTPPGPSALLETYGQSSPMRLAWTFFGYSAAYQRFAGLAEAVGGVLLFFRRTTSLGALLLIGVLANVVMVNFCFDVPVKIFSSNLLLMAIFLAAPELPRLGGLLLGTQPVAATVTRGPEISHRWMNCAGWVFKLGFLLLTLINLTWRDLRMKSDFAAARPQTPPFGAWEVTEAGGMRWKRLTLYTHLFQVTTTDDSTERFGLEHDAAKKTLTLSASTPPDGGLAGPWVLTYENPDADQMVLDGPPNGSQVSVRLKRIDVSKFPLNARGFHWVNEFPFNR